jgi:hypothetical protein
MNTNARPARTKRVANGLAARPNVNRPVTIPVMPIAHMTSCTLGARSRERNGRNEAFSARTSMSIAAPVVSVSVTYIGPALTAGSGLSTNSTSETTISRATTKTTLTSTNRLLVRSDRAPGVGRDTRPGLCPADCGLFDLLRLISSAF